MYGCVLHCCACCCIVPTCWQTHSWLAVPPPVTAVLTQTKVLAVCQMLPSALLRCVLCFQLIIPPAGEMSVLHTATAPLCLRQLHARCLSASVLSDEAVAAQYHPTPPPLYLADLNCCNYPDLMRPIASCMLHPLFPPANPLRRCLLTCRKDVFPHPVLSSCPMKS